MAANTGAPDPKELEKCIKAAASLAKQLKKNTKELSGIEGDVKELEAFFESSNSSGRNQNVS